jgi:hypothetical protein
MAYLALGTRRAACVAAGLAQLDQCWTKEDEGSRCSFAIYVESGRMAEFTSCLLRRAPRLSYASFSAHRLRLTGNYRNLDLP